MTSIGGDWVEIYDPSSGMNYYLNNVTGESTWTYPDISGGAATAAESSNDTYPWEEKVDETSGYTYYYNNVTFESSWTKPDDFDAHSGNKATSTAAPTAESSQADVPENWVIGVDPSSGQEYYYNNLTQATQWEKPECLKSPAKPAAPAPKATEKETAKASPVKADAPSAEKTKKTSVLIPQKQASLLKAKQSILKAQTESTSPKPAASILLTGGEKPKPAPSMLTTSVEKPKPAPSILATNVEKPVVEKALAPVVEEDKGEKAEENFESAIAEFAEPNMNRKSSFVSEMAARLSETTIAGGPPFNPFRPHPPPRASVSSLPTESTDPKPVDNPTPPPPPPAPQKAQSKKQNFDELRALEATTTPADETNEKKDVEGDDEGNNTDTPVEEKSLTNNQHSSAGGNTKAYILQTADDKSTDELVEQVQGITFDQYAEKYFNFDRKGLFKSRTTVEKVTQWKHDLIKTSLRQLSSDMAQEAVQLYRNVTGYMGDRSSSKPGPDHAHKILNSLLLSPEELRDEIFCQIVKQTNANPNPASTTKGWELFAICLSVVPPSSDLMAHLMAYFAANLNSDIPLVAKLAELCLHKCSKICKLGPRRELPTNMEFESLRKGDHVLIKVFYLDNKYTVMRVDSWTTAHDLEEALAKRLKLQKDAAFSLFEVSSKEEERVLDTEERILDLVAFWQRTELEEIGKGAKEEDLEHFRFVYKVGLFYNIEESDTAGVELMYVQATHDVVDARYPCSEQDATTLAALQMQEQCGDYPESGHCTHLRGKLGTYVSSRLIEHKSVPELEESIYKLYEKLKGYSQMEARLSYLDYVKTWKIYGSTYFFAEPQNNKDLPKETVLAINSRGILVVDPTTKEFLSEYDYANVVTWGHSANSFVVITGSSNRQNKMYFKTDQGKEINNMVRCYMEYRQSQSS